MTYQPRKMPRREDIGADEVLIDITGDAEDGEGRIQFVAYWLDGTPQNQGGPPAGVRGQVFYASIAKFTERQAKKGKTVKEWTP